MGGLDQTFDSIIALGVTAGLLLFGTVYYYRVANIPDKKSTSVKKILPRPIVKPASSIPVNTATRQNTSSAVSSSSVSSSNGVTTSTSSEMKGYKMTSDGRKTTYFNREITDEEKLLLGDFTPKPLAVNNVPVTNSLGVQSISAKSSSSTGSAWNTAGTWEEKNRSPWAAKRLNELLKLASISISVNKKDVGTINISNINSVEGDALITMTRGTKKYIYDYTISLNWKLQIGITVLTGTVIVSDINAECDYEFDISPSSSNPSTVLTKENIQKYVKSKSEGLQLLIRQKLDRFLLDFKLLEN